MAQAPKSAFKRQKVRMEIRENLPWVIDPILVHEVNIRQRFGPVHFQF